LQNAIAQAKDRARELAKRVPRCRRRKDGERVLEGRLLAQRHERKAEQRKKRNRGFGDAASRYPEHFGMVAADPDQ